MSYNKKNPFLCSIFQYFHNNIFKNILKFYFRQDFVKFDGFFVAHSATFDSHSHIFSKSRMSRMYMFQVSSINIAFAVSKF